MKTLSGISVAPGFVIGKAFLCPEDEREIPRYSIAPEKAAEEIQRFITAAEEAAAELRALETNSRYFQRSSPRNINKEQAAIFEAHLLMLEDPDFHYQIKARLESKYENIEWIVFEVSRDLSRKLMESSDAYLRERAADVVDVARRIIDCLLGTRRFTLTGLDEDVILAARNLLPSEVLGMNKDRVKALVMDAGSRTCHTAILLRSFGIPSVLGLSNAIREITPGGRIIVDGGAGLVILDPDAETLKSYEKKIAGAEKAGRALSALRNFPAETTDGRLVSLKANIGVSEEAADLDRYGAEGIGLFRSEFLFLQNSRGSEEEQLEAYSAVIKAMKGKPVTIRTVDLGGDKVLPGMQMEENPLLGWRAIRFSLSLPDLFKTQLRAILRSSVYGPVRIMFPMISGIEELEEALAILDEARAECRKKGQAFADTIETGTMIEVPAAVMTAGILAEKSDFFSIGTNDLVQYTLAVDRGNEKVNYLAKPTHPAVLRFIKQTIDAAHAKGITAAMCGELAGEPSATALLLGLGLDEFSMTAASIPQIKHIIRSISFESSRALAEEALASTSYRTVESLVQRWYAEHLDGI
ncbi:phosphoenolpyruvate-protein phosphotransferase [Spirochaetia bacterium]|nr:phosphoenolpyruvate-protein phosphotransferase [Spirochaetia bacterium]